MTLEREKNDESEIEFHSGGLENRGLSWLTNASCSSAPAS
jgi:hypothetical protein